MHTDLFHKFEYIAESSAVFVNGVVVLAAVSGGSDSMCLLSLLEQYQLSKKIRLIVCHYNHNLRGAESDDDEAFVRDYCRNKDLEYICESGNVKAFSQNTGRSLEDSARELRYEFLQRTAGLYNNAIIVVAHHMTDQFETVMLNLFRGSGLAGIGGMKQKSGNIFRPLLFIEKNEIINYISENNIPYRDDSTNFIADTDRNKLRLEMIMQIEKLFGRDIIASVCRTSRAVTDDEDFLSKCAQQTMSEELTNDGFNRDKFKNLHPAIAYRVLKSMYANAKGDAKNLEMKHIILIKNFIAGSNVSGMLSLCDEMVFKVRRNLFWFEKVTAKNELDSTIVEINAYDLFDDIAKTGSAVLPGGICILSNNEINIDLPSKEKDNFVLEGAFNYNREELKNCIWRNRKAGDKIRIADRNLSKTIKKLFNELKIDESLKDKIPLLVKGNEVLFIPGICFAEGYKNILKLSKPNKNMMIDKSCAIWWKYVKNNT